MNKFVKIISIIALISVITGILCISSFALNNSVYYGLTISSGTVVTFKNTLDPEGIDFSSSPTYPINFTYGNAQFNGINFKITYSIRTMYYTRTGNNPFSAYNFDGQNIGFSGDKSQKTITLTSDYTLENDVFGNFLINNIETGLPELPQPPHIEPSFWENVSGFFTETLNSGTAIVNWMTATPIALIPLALYCLIVIIAISKRLIKG